MVKVRLQGTKQDINWFIERVLKNNNEVSGEEEVQKQTQSDEQVQEEAGDLMEKNRQEKVEADEKEREGKIEKKIDSVTVTYEKTEDAAGVEIIRENEEKLNQGGQTIIR